MTDDTVPPAPDQHRALLARLITDGAHHALCARLSRTEEGRLAHDGLAAGFHLTAMYTADLLTTGQLQGSSAHATRPEDQTAAQQVIDTLSEDPSERARAIGNAIHSRRRCDRLCNELQQLRIDWREQQ